MSIYATKTSSEPTIEAGTYLARCISMISIGTVPVEYKGEIKLQDKVRISWELPTELKEFKEGEGKKPLTISKNYTLSMHPKSNLRKDLEGWRGKGFTDQEAERFDITVLLGKVCQLSIVHQPKKDGSGSYATINSIVTIPKGTTVPPQITPLFEFTYEDFDEGKFNSLPDFLKDEMKKSKEYKKHLNPSDTEITQEETIPEQKDDDLPF